MDENEHSKHNLDELMIAMVCVEFVQNSKSYKKEEITDVQFHLSILLDR
jgi:hypothetical protein